MSKSKNHDNRRYIDDYEVVKQKKLKKESRHNFKDHLRDVMERGEWDQLEEELYYESHKYES